MEGVFGGGGGGWRVTVCAQIQLSLFMPLNLDPLRCRRWSGKPVSHLPTVVYTDTALELSPNCTKTSLHLNYLYKSVYFICHICIVIVLNINIQHIKKYALNIQDVEL